MYPHLQGATTSIPSKKIVASVSKTISPARVYSRMGGILDGQTNVVVPSKVNSQLDILYRRCIDNIGREACDITAIFGQ